MNCCWSRNARERRWTLLLASLIAIGCSAGADEGAIGPPHQVLGADYQPLRSAFEADSGKVRAILLGSPT